MRSAGMSESHSVASTSTQNAALQGLSSVITIIITIRYHCIGHSADGLGRDFDPGRNHRDCGIGNSHHGTGLQGKSEAHSKQPSAKRVG